MLTSFTRNAARAMNSIVSQGVVDCGSLIGRKQHQAIDAADRRGDVGALQRLRRVPVARPRWYGPAISTMPGREDRGRSDRPNSDAVARRARREQVGAEVGDLAVADQDRAGVLGCRRSDQTMRALMKAVDLVCGAPPRTMLPRSWLGRATDPSGAPAALLELARRCATEWEVALTSCRLAATDRVAAATDQGVEARPCARPRPSPTCSWMIERVKVVGDHRSRSLHRLVHPGRMA